LDVVSQDRITALRLIFKRLAGLWERYGTTESIDCLKTMYMILLSASQLEVKLSSCSPAPHVTGP